MITCEACKEHLYPIDPSVPAGKYHYSTCDYYCGKSDHDREHEMVVVSPQPRREPVSRYEYEQLKNEVRGWRERHAQTLLAQDKLNTQKKRNSYTISI